MIGRKREGAATARVIGRRKRKESRREKDLNEEKRSPPRAGISRLLRHAADVARDIFYPLAPGREKEGTWSCCINVLKELRRLM